MLSESAFGVQTSESLNDACHSVIVIALLTSDVGKTGSVSIKAICIVMRVQIYNFSITPLTVSKT